LGLTKIEAGPQGGRLQFAKTTKIKPITIVQMVQQDPATYRLQNNDQLSFNVAMESAEARFSTVNAILNLLLDSIESAVGQDAVAQA
jgi:transcription-repair coupling factor (superfamily II helicase)